MTTVTTSTSLKATFGGRLSTVTSDGTLWAASYNLANTRWEFRYSTDDGATWTEDTSLRITKTGAVLGALDWVSNASGTLIFATHTSDTALVVHIKEGPGSGWTRTKDTVGRSGWETRDIVSLDLCAGAASGLWWCVVGSEFGDVRLASSTTGSGGSVSAVSLCAAAFGVSGGAQVAIDWAHAADGTTSIDGSFPSVFVAYRKTTSTVLRKVSGTLATLGTERTLSSSTPNSTDPLSVTFDGSQAVVTFIDGSSRTAAQWHERDFADTATTSRTLPALSDGDVTSLSAIHTPTGNVRLFAVGTTSDDVKATELERSTGVFGSWVTLATTTATAGTMSVQRRAMDTGYSVVWTSGASSPYDVVFALSAYNRAPNAPTWDTASPADVTASLALVWDFNDDDPGDGQYAYALRRSVNGGGFQWWNAGSSSWTTETKNVSGVSGVTLSSGWASDGDTVEYWVKTWDVRGDLVSPLSDALPILATTPVTAAITSPTDMGTVTTAAATVAWTASEQTAYQVRLLSDVGAQLWSTGKVASTDTSTVTPSMLVNGESYQVEVIVWNDDDFIGPADVHDFDVVYTAPATPTYTITALPASGSIRVVIADPTPSGGEPDVVSHDLFVRVAAGERTDGERTETGIRIATGLAPDGTYFDYAAASGVDYEYRTLAFGDNGAVVYGAWT